MIKVTVGEQKTQSEKPFPRLMKINDGIFLFLSKKECVCLKATKGVHNEFWEVGEHCLTASMQYFTDYNETITIQNA